MREVRLSDGWSQSEADGITKDWKIESPFGGGLAVMTITFNEDQTMLWNLIEVENPEELVEKWKNLPSEGWNTYEIDDSVNAITVTVTFEYVGIVKKTVVDFDAFMDHEGH